MLLNLKLEIYSTSMAKLFNKKSKLIHIILMAVIKY